MVYVYNPDDEPDQEKYNGTVFVLPAQTVLEIVSPWPDIKPETIANHLVEKLGRWGVAIVAGPKDREGIDAADAVYLKGTMTWASDVVLEAYQKAKPYREAGIDGPPESEDAVKARRWLSDHRPALITAGLIVPR